MPKAQQSQDPKSPKAQQSQDPKSPKFIDLAKSSESITAKSNDTVVATEGQKQVNFVSKIYEVFSAQFGNANPAQMFSLCWPGTVLDPAALGVENDHNEIPLKQLIRTAQVMDAYVPPAPITQPDGTRTSDRYKMAINQLAPQVNPQLNKLQEIVRNKINEQIEIVIDGEKKAMSMADAFYQLYSQWVAKKREWSTLVNKKKEELSATYKGDPSKQYQEFLSWYTTVAESYISGINLAYTNLISQFPLAQWQDSIAILDTYSDGGLEDAKIIMRNATLAVPPEEGFTYLPTQSIPASWANQIVPSTGFIDYLSDPELQKSVFQTAMEQLNVQISAWQAIVPQIDDADIKQKAKAFSEANTEYRNSWSNIRNKYSSNTATAAQILIDIYAAKGEDLDSNEENTKKVNQLAESLKAQNNEPTDKLDDPTKDDPKAKKLANLVKELNGMQQSLNDAQTSAIDRGFQLADAANEYLSTEGRASNMSWMKTYIVQLQESCERAKAQLANFSSSSQKYAQYLNTVPEYTGDDHEPNPNYSPEFASNVFPKAVADPQAQGWSEIKISIDQSELKSSSSLATSFSQRDWGVNFFLGSASGTNSVAGTEFAETMMTEDSKIELGCLAQKIVIQRPWMKSEVFANTASMYRTMEKPLSPLSNDFFNTLNPQDREDSKKVNDLINKYQFPSYPVAFIVVKDLCVKVNITAAQTKRAREQWNKTKSQGGGFFCFSISDSTKETTDNESMNSYAMSGQIILRAPTPQIIGYYSQMLPPDESEVLTTSAVQEMMETMRFLTNLKEVHSSEPVPSIIPTENV
ncbi:hypothetical protein ACIL2U_002165 [Vibrio alginolyticus]